MSRVELLPELREEGCEAMLVEVGSRSPIIDLMFSYENCRINNWAWASASALAAF
jgi:hypothetical protein